MLTDAQINDLLSMPKHVENPGAKTRTEGKHIRRDFRVKSTDGQHEFALFYRQSLVMPDSFSTGLRWMARGGEPVMLICCNGAGHPHSNAIEGERLEFVRHIHIATERYLAAGKKEEGYAEPTNDYITVDGALDCLVRRCNITGLNTKADSPDLFTGLLT